MSTFEQYYETYSSKMSDIPVHRDFMAVLDWVKDRPGSITSIDEIARVISGEERPGRDAVRRAVGATLILTSWPEAIGDVFFEVVGTDGVGYPVDAVPQEVVDGEAPYLLEATGEIIADFPSRARPRIRIAEFDLSGYSSQRV